MKTRAARPGPCCLRGLRFDGPRSRPATLAVALLVLGSSHTRPAWGQDEVRNFRKPILTVETGGHHARVRSLIWQDDFTLLSGGEDKVVKVWGFRDGVAAVPLDPAADLCGPVGTIYAIAVTRPDAQGQSFLAVGGYGVESRGSDVTIFRVPGVEQQAGDDPSGEIVARLLSPPENQPQQIGHRNSVFCLAFDPSGRVLASGSMDTTVILWDVPTFRPRTVLRGHTREVRALAFSPDGQRIATAGGDGSVRLWDVATGVQIDVRVTNPQQPAPINTLAFRPGGPSLAIGCESGELFLFDARALSRVAPVQLPTLPAQGPVESLTYSPDGRRFAVSIKSDRLDRLDPMTLACDVEVRAMPEGNVLRRWRVPGLVHALAFSPRGPAGLRRGAGPVPVHPGRDRPRTAPSGIEGIWEHTFRPGVHGRQPGPGFHPRGLRPGEPPGDLRGLRPRSPSGVNGLPQPAPAGHQHLRRMDFGGQHPQLPAGSGESGSADVAIRPQPRERAVLVVVHDDPAGSGACAADRGGRLRVGGGGL